MDLETMIQTLTDQGPTYWIAAAAVALGVTLLVTAAALQWRRLRSSGTTRRRHPVAKPVQHQAAVADYTAQAAKSSLALPNAVDPALAGRLAVAADRLTAIRADLAHWDHLPDASDLKAPASHVEYVFRSGEA